MFAYESNEEHKNSDLDPLNDDIFNIKMFEAIKFFEQKS